ncbi:MAG TPA: hypothetical protein VGG24_17065 [Paraburkholderia sp.]
MKKSVPYIVAAALAVGMVSAAEAHVSLGINLGVPIAPAYPVVVAPPVAYAPPPVVYAPPPAVYAPPPAVVVGYGGYYGYPYYRHGYYRGGYHRGYGHYYRR